MSADLVRRAATLMRERAEVAAGCSGDGSWFVGADSYTVWANHDPRGLSSSQLLDVDREEYAEHIASWHPVVALAVADWLDTVVQAIEPDPGRTIANIDEQAALAVARSYLGES